MEPIILVHIYSNASQSLLHVSTLLSESLSSEGLQGETSFTSCDQQDG